MTFLLVIAYIFIIWGLFLALPVFAAIVGTGLAGIFLYHIIK